MQTVARNAAHVIVAAACVVAVIAQGWKSFTQRFKSVGSRGQYLSAFEEQVRFEARIGVQA